MKIQTHLLKTVLALKVEIFGGCTDSLAINYDTLATYDDGSCEFDTVGTIVGRDIYIVGESYNSNGEWTSCYWKNGERFELPGGYLATDITVVNGVVYTSGSADQDATGLIRNDLIYPEMEEKLRRLRLMEMISTLLVGTTMDPVTGRMEFVSI